MGRFARLEAFFGIDTEEIGLLLFFIVVSTYLLVGSLAYSGFVGRYPRVFSAVVLVCAVLCLFRQRLPEPLATITSEPPDLVGFDEDEAEDDPLEQRARSAETRTVFGVTLSKRAIVTLTVAGYMIASVLVGILVATPLYVLAWGYLVNIDRNRLIAVTVGTTIVLFGFMEFAGINVDIGVLF
ncbi:hypothetical protein D8Y22_04245 [Salinadaptatus halalkaliphilus]|uniref:Tripartite tricarboxylate transporter TctB family protein n=1 Tax=Salinadaptatus halalkaliphilus TaxID=2419781 RepID=A0A4V3VLM3_9EURY|nr:hypothetical protein [Salinadaptatus halalkaliphilus]THE66137.1 hypothetical protein D8Y22_04245 [Salinadaptatus halalkaliphilus]